MFTQHLHEQRCSGGQTVLAPTSKFVCSREACVRKCPPTSMLILQFQVRIREACRSCRTGTLTAVETRHAQHVQGNIGFREGARLAGLASVGDLRLLPFIPKVDGVTIFLHLWSQHLAELAALAMQVLGRGLFNTERGAAKLLMPIGGLQLTGFGELLQINSSTLNPVSCNAADLA